MDYENGTESAQLLAAAKTLNDERIVAVGENDASIIVLPEGRHVESLQPLIDAYRKAPRRIKGEARIGDMDSFLAHVKRFGDVKGSGIFATPNPTAPVVVAVYDYSAPDAPAFHDHRARYAPQFSDEWKAWAAQNDKQISQADFASFLEDRIGDVIVPDTAGADSALQDFANLVQGSLATPQRLIELSRGLAVTAELRAKQAVNLSSGEITAQFEEAHVGEGGQTVRVPSLFVIAIPVFYAGPAYRIPVRLRYRLREGRIAWSYALHRADKVFQHAFDEIVASARTSGLPVFVGSPEA